MFLKDGEILAHQTVALEDASLDEEVLEAVQAALRSVGFAISDEELKRSTKTYVDNSAPKGAEAAEQDAGDDSRHSGALLRS